MNIPNFPFASLHFFEHCSKIMKLLFENTHFCIWFCYNSISLQIEQYQIKIVCVCLLTETFAFWPLKYHLQYCSKHQKEEEEKNTTCAHKLENLKLIIDPNIYMTSCFLSIIDIHYYFSYYYYFLTICCCCCYFCRTKRNPRNKIYCQKR